MEDINNNWIELNLPFSYYENLNLPSAPDLNDKAFKVFGKTLDEYYSSISNEKWMKYDKLLFKTEEDILAEDPDINIDDYRKRVSEDISSSEDTDIQCVLDYRKFYKTYNDWLNQQPEMKKWNDDVALLREEYKVRIVSKSFSGLGLNKPGVLIEIECGNKTEQYLIGDINCIRGVCDDCVAFEKDVIVKRYKIVWEK